ncbi:glycoside hydrolase family 15 protein [Natrialbaceae archaeon A-gly3]
MSRPTTDHDEYVPIERYGLIGNANRCALVGTNGSIDWCPFPHVESPSVFAAILDTDGGGRFAIEPPGEYESHQTYVDRTNVLKTTFETDDGTATVTDFMPVRDRGEPDEQFQTAIYRKAESKTGAVDLEVTVEPRLDYARAETILEATDEVALVARTTEADHGPLYLHTDVDLEIDDERARTTLSLEAGEEIWFGVHYGRESRLSREERADVLEGTIEYWRTWLEGCEDSATDLFEFDEEWRNAIARSALVLKLCIHEETGAICAAPTTSLPEEIGGELNWDYRYNWIRDAKFTIQALYNVGQADEACRYFEWFREIGHEDPGEIQPLYGLHSEAEIGEEVLEHLSGYRDSQPVRVGNAAADQKQLDIYGTIVQGIYETIRYENGLTDYDWESVRALAEYVCDHWGQRDEGIWEFRDLHEHFVHSKLLCWVALDRAIRLAEEYDREGPLERWERERRAIREAIETRGYDDDTESFVQYFGAKEALDATALLIPIYDFLPPEDERVQNTIDTILEDLTTEDGLVYRFAGSDAREREPGGFVLCSFWLIDALVVSGRLEEAEEIFENVLEYTSPLGLLSEMIHAEEEIFLGNFPQAFSHIGLLNSALYLASANDEAGNLPPEELSKGESSPLFRRHGS